MGEHHIIPIVCHYGTHRVRVLPYGGRALVVISDAAKAFGASPLRVRTTLPKNLIHRCRVEGDYRILPAARPRTIAAFMQTVLENARGEDLTIWWQEYVLRQFRELQFFTQHELPPGEADVLAASYDDLLRTAQEPAALRIKRIRLRDGTLKNVDWEVSTAYGYLRNVAHLEELKEVKRRP